MNPNWLFLIVIPSVFIIWRAVGRYCDHVEAAEQRKAKEFWERLYKLQKEANDANRIH